MTNPKVTNGKNTAGKSANDGDDDDDDDDHYDDHHNAGVEWHFCPYTVWSV